LGSGYMANGAGQGSQEAKAGLAWVLPAAEPPLSSAAGRRRPRAASPDALHDVTEAVLRPRALVEPELVRGHTRVKPRAAK
jgi:hypothetical protein